MKFKYTIGFFHKFLIKIHKTLINALKDRYTLTEWFLMISQTNKLLIFIE